MKYILLVLITSLSTWVFSQEKVSWAVSYNAAEHQVEFRATIADGWHLYSQFIQNDIGPVPTAFVFDENETVKWSGNVQEPEAIHAYDENFEASLDFFKNQAVFTRKVSTGSKGTITGYITYMVCNEIMCLPPVDESFSITIP
ncbi:MAG: protein-disulfide reductase DsbD domain-containing protein [Bacteroidota bacterium]